MIHSTNLNKSNYSNITTLPIQRKAIAPYFNGIDNDSFNKVNTDTDKNSLKKSKKIFKNKYLNFLAFHLLGITTFFVIGLLPSPLTGKSFNPFKSKEDFKTRLALVSLFYFALMGLSYLNDYYRKKNANKSN